MPVRILIYGKEALFSQGCWECEDESLTAMLQALSDPRAMSDEEERRVALYAAGRYGGSVFEDGAWVLAPLPEPEIKMPDLTIEKPARSSGGGLFGMLRRRR